MPLIFKILIWLATSKTDHSMDGGRWRVGGGEIAISSHLKLFYFTKMPFYSQNYPFVFQNCPLVLQKYLLFIYYARLFPRMPFSSLLWLLLVLLKAAQRHNCLAVVLFPLGTIYWPIYWIYLNLSHSIWEGKLNPHSNRYQIKWFKVTSIPDNVKNSKWSTGAWLFMYSNFSHHDSFENAVSEHSWNSTIF